LPMPATSAFISCQFDWISTGCSYRERVRCSSLARSKNLFSVLRISNMCVQTRSKHNWAQAAWWSPGPGGYYPHLPKMHVRASWEGSHRAKRRLYNFTNQEAFLLVNQVVHSSQPVVGVPAGWLSHHGDSSFGLSIISFFFNSFSWGPEAPQIIIFFGGGGGSNLCGRPSRKTPWKSWVLGPWKGTVHKPSYRAHVLEA
jgi:hypothetical protein